MPIIIDGGGDIVPGTSRGNGRWAMDVAMRDRDGTATNTRMTMMKRTTTRGAAPYLSIHDLGAPDGQSPVRDPDIGLRAGVPAHCEIVNESTRSRCSGSFNGSMSGYNT